MRPPILLRAPMRVSDSRRTPGGSGPLAEENDNQESSEGAIDARARGGRTLPLPRTESHRYSLIAHDDFDRVLRSAIVEAGQVDEVMQSKV